MNDSYLNLSVEALATDPVVKAYLLKGEDTAAWEAWLEEHPSEAVKMMKVQRRVLQNQEDSKPVDQDNTSSTIGEIANQEIEPAAKRVGGIRGWVRRKEWGKVLVLAAAAFATLYYLYTIKLGGELHETTSGEQRIVALPDGSKVHLAPESILRVKYADDERALNLLGDAFFEVKAGLPFLVNTAAGNVSTVGASFSVEARITLAVACATGEIKVNQKADEAILNPGFSVTSTPAGFSELSAIPPDAIAPWRAGRLLLKKQSIAEVIKQFERYYSRGFKVERSLRSKQVDLDVPTDDFPLAIERVNFVLQVEVDTSRRMINRG